MKLSLLSLLAFFAIATTVKGQLRRRNNEDDEQITDTTEQEHNVEPLDSLDLDDNALAHAQKRMGILSSKNDTTSPGLTEKVTTRATSVYNYCEDYLLQVGNGYVKKFTNRMGGVVTPILGCVAIKGEYWNGLGWVHIDNSVDYACVGGTGVMEVFGVLQTYSIDVFNADGDMYNLQVCWD